MLELWGRASVLLTKYLNSFPQVESSGTDPGIAFERLIGQRIRLWGSGDLGESAWVSRNGCLARSICKFRRMTKSLLNQSRPAMLNDVNHSPPRTTIPPDRWETIAQLLKLSNRELQIVQQLFAGGSEADTSRALGISAHTVHTHLGRLYRKLNVHGCSGLFLRVFDAYVADANVSARIQSSQDETMVVSRHRSGR